MGRLESQTVPCGPYLLAQVLRDVVQQDIAMHHHILGSNNIFAACVVAGMFFAWHRRSGLLVEAEGKHRRRR